MAQFILYQRFPQEPVEPKQFTILVEEREADRGLLRGDGSGGAYNWDGMIAVPDDDTTDQQRRAIGVLCHDAAIAINTEFRAGGSGASLDNVVKVFLETFQYDNAVWAEGEGGHVTRKHFISLFNCNLDAGIPVILGFRNSDYPWIGHAALCDGYGYNLSILYHHLNMGWEGQNDCWYNLPDIAGPNTVPFDSINQCVYNIFTDGTGEIISGRIIDADGRPFEDVTVTAKSEMDTDFHTAVTNGNGIYAFKGLDSDTVYTITPGRMGHDFDLNLGYGPELNNVSTGRSGGGSFVTGNRWGIDFIGYSNSDTVSIGQETSAWDYPMHTEHHDSRTQVIYLASEIGRSGTITALALDVSKIPEGPMTNWTIRIKHTGLSEYTSASLDAIGWTVVCRTADSDVGEGWQTFEFQTPYEYNGTDNLLVDFSHNNLSDSQNGQCRASRPGGMRAVYAYSNSQHDDPLNWSGTTSPATSLSDLIPNVKLMFGRESQVVCTDVKLTASDGERDDHFGCSVAMSGDYAIVGAYGDDDTGAAYIFKREGTSWTEQAKLRKPFPRGSDDYFGYSVSISEDRAIVGAGSVHSERNPIGAFTAYIFKRNGTSWTLQNELKSLDMETHDFFGSSVSISGDYAIVGSSRDDSDTEKYDKYDFGSISIFECDGINWIQDEKLFASDGVEYDYFGEVVSICGDYAIVSKGYGPNPSPFFGPVYIYKREGTSWTEQVILNSLERSFGNSMSISEDYAIIGAYRENNENGDGSGSVYVFEREGANWTEQSRLIALDGESFAHFGSSVSINGDLIIVGSPDDDDHYKGRNSGSAYIFERDGEGWTQQAKLTAMDAAYDDFLGTSVAIDGDYAIVGAPNDDDKGRDSGSVYVFKRIGSVWTP